VEKGHQLEVDCLYYWVHILRVSQLLRGKGLSIVSQLSFVLGACDTRIAVVAWERVFNWKSFLFVLGACIARITIVA